MPSVKQMITTLVTVAVSMAVINRVPAIKQIVG